MPVKLAGVEYQANAQAILYNYFSTLKTYPVYVDAQNYKDVIEFIYLSYELGGFPLVDIVFEPTSSSDYQ